MASLSRCIFWKTQFWEHTFEVEDVFNSWCSCLVLGVSASESTTCTNASNHYILAQMIKICFYCCQRLLLYLNNLFTFGEHFQTKRFLVKHWRNTIKDKLQRFPESESDFVEAPNIIKIWKGCLRISMFNRAPWCKGCLKGLRWSWFQISHVHIYRVSQRCHDVSWTQIRKSFGVSPSLLSWNWSSGVSAFSINKVCDHFQESLRCAHDWHLHNFYHT